MTGRGKDRNRSLANPVHRPFLPLVSRRKRGETVRNDQDGDRGDARWRRRQRVPEVKEGPNLKLGSLEMAAKEDPKITNCKITEGELTKIETTASKLDTNDQRQLDSLETSLNVLQKIYSDMYPDNPVIAINTVKPEIDKTRIDIVTHVGLISDEIKSLTRQIKNIRQLCSLLH
ncbi:hypothetical protein [Paraburkholderia terrae]